ncbi:hypothetical protein DMB92_08370 [Campylobacter sp. MIT 99-7217]|uniref:hypothetical protein n=1 Tax=Campylobacter sp. MIT 99-7217 TaxID=535091 RepID=UPI00115ACE7F|nr:hypothetical protein [Campylobacter sp. MIT 99-7217]TQR29367.1 hypothetical protein DMB92_08370 [Campylobacter sp. MIT 99-7217]
MKNLKSLILALAFLCVNLAWAEEIFKDYDKFIKDCQSKNAHFYTCRFFALKIDEKLNSIEWDLIREDWQAIKTLVLVLDTFHNKNINNYLTEGVKKGLKELFNSAGQKIQDDIKNNPEQKYKDNLRILNDRIKENGRELR